MNDLIEDCNNGLRIVMPKRPRERRQRDDLPEALKQAIDFLLKQNDMARLEKFIAGRPQAEVEKILKYIEGKTNGRNNT